MAPLEQNAMHSTTAIEPVEKPLSTLAERPDADVVIYDGIAGCARPRCESSTWWDCQHRLAYLSLHDPEVRGDIPICRTMH